MNMSDQFATRTGIEHKHEVSAEKAAATSNKPELIPLELLDTISGGNNPLYHGSAASIQNPLYRGS